MDTSRRIISARGVFLFAVVAWSLRLTVAASVVLVSGLLLWAHPNATALRSACLIAPPALQAVSTDPIVQLGLNLFRDDQRAKTLVPLTTATTSLCQVALQYLAVQERTSEQSKLEDEGISRVNGALDQAFEGLRVADKQLRRDASKPQREFAPYEFLASGLELLLAHENDLRVASALHLHMLTLQGTEKWFVGFQNLSEARATGGILGNYAVLALSSDGVEIVEIGSNTDLFSLGLAEIDESLRSHFQVLGADSTDWRDINSYPDQVAVSRSIHNSIESVTDHEIAGVVLMGQGVVSRLIALSGGTVFDGREISADEAFDLLTGAIYAIESDRTLRLGLLESLIKESFTRLSKGDFSPRVAFEYAQNARDSDHLLAWSENASLQQLLGGTTGLSSNLHISLNNVGANKLDRFTEIEVKNCYASNASGRQVRLQIDINNLAPKFGLPEHVAPMYTDSEGRAIVVGTARVQLLITVPEDWLIEDFYSSSALQGFPMLQSPGRVTYVFETEILPGAKVSQSIVFAGLDHAGSPGLEYSPLLNRPTIARICE